MNIESSGGMSSPHLSQTLQVLGLIISLISDLPKIDPQALHSRFATNLTEMQSKVQLALQLGGSGVQDRVTSPCRISSLEASNIILADLGLQLEQALCLNDQDLHHIGKDEAKEAEIPVFMRRKGQKILISRMQGILEKLDVEIKGLNRAESSTIVEDGVVDNLKVEYGMLTARIESLLADIIVSLTPLVSWLDSDSLYLCHTNLV